MSTYFNDDTQFFPQEIKILDDSKVALKFNTSTSGRVVIAKAGHILSGSFVAENATVTDTFTSATSKTVTHGFGTKNVIVQVYEGDNVINPDSISTTDNNNVTVTFGTPRTGRIVVAKGGHIVTGVPGSIGFDSIINKPTLISSSAQITSSDLDMNGNKVLFANVYSGTGDLPSAATYHGMFAHVHSTGQGYFAHAGQWIELATSESLSSTITNNTGSLSTKVDNQNANSGSISFWQGSQTEYDAISSSADPNTLYIIRS